MDNDFSEKLGALLSNPEALAKIAGIAWRNFFVTHKHLLNIIAAFHCPLHKFIAKQV